MRDRMLEAARDLLVEEGLAGFSMRKVASACDVSATAIYRHFDDRDALLASAVQQGFRIFSAYLMDALEQPTAFERFRAAGQRYFDFARDHERYYALMFMTNCEDLGLETLDEQGKREIDGTFRFLVDRIVDGQRSGVVREGDPEALAVFVWSSMHGLASLRIGKNLGVDDTRYETLTAAQIDDIGRAIAPRDSSLPSPQLASPQLASPHPTSKGSAKKGSAKKAPSRPRSTEKRSKKAPSTQGSTEKRTAGTTLQKRSASAPRRASRRPTKKA